MDTSRGVPLLSGPVPDDFTIDERAEMSCRKCNKEFNLLFARGRRCEHCGYQYCNACSDYQALMPRYGFGAGYDRVHVCAFCIQYLQITAGGKTYLRTLSLAKLRNYMQSYGLRLGPDVIEKEDVINAIVNARGRNGCLPSYHENYYRKNAVPNGQASRPRGMFSRSERNPIPQQHLDPRSEWRNDNNFARPDLEELLQEQARETGQSNQNTGPAPRSSSYPTQADEMRPGSSPFNPSPSQPLPSQYAPPPGPPPSFGRSQSTHLPDPPRSSAGPQPNAHAAPRYQYQQAPYYPQSSPHSQFSPPPQQYQPPPRQSQTFPPQWQPRPQTTTSSHAPPPPYNRHYDHANSSPQGQSELPHRRTSAYPTPQPSAHSSPGPQPARPPSSTASGMNSPRRRTSSLRSTSPQRTPSRPLSSTSPTSTPSETAVPSLDELLETDEESLIHLSVSTLKSILFKNRVNIGSLPILEKGELVERVKRLLDAERRERVHAAAIREREEWEKAEKEWAEREARRERTEAERRARRERFRATVEDASESSEDAEAPRMDVDGTDAVLEVNEESAFAEATTARDDTGQTASAPESSGGESHPIRQQSPPPRARSPSPPSRFPQERNGLCVVCQDEESNIVIVDCGHLALCRGCADLIWSSSRECPLCRTRIITEARMLRVFKS